MRRITLGLLFLAWCAASAEAGVRRYDLRVSPSARNYGSASENVRGYVDEILIDVPAASYTGTVSVIAAREISTIAALSLATNKITGDYIVRPVVDATDGTGSDLTSDPPRRPLLIGETVTFVVTNATGTNVEWRCIIKTSDGE